MTIIYPNPFNPSTNIRFDLPDAAFENIRIYDFTGREVTSLLNENLSAGSYEAEFNPDNLASGVYFYKMDAGNFSDTKRMILIK